MGIRWTTGILLGTIAFMPHAALDGSASGSQVVSVVGSDNGVLVTTVDPGEQPEVWLLTDDGRIKDGWVPASAAMPKVEDCAATDCFRVVAGRLAVQESSDGGTTYTVAWELPAARYDELVAAYDGLRPESTSVVVRRTAQGAVVFVANGPDGLLYRDATGVWVRKGVPRGGEGWYFDEPARLSTDPPPTDIGPYAGGTVFVILLFFGALFMHLRGTLRSWRLPRAVAIASAGGAISWLATSEMPDVGMFSGPMYGLFPLSVLTVIIGLAVLYQTTGPVLPSRRP